MFPAAWVAALDIAVKSQILIATLRALQGSGPLFPKQSVVHPHVSENLGFALLGIGERLARLCRFASFDRFGLKPPEFEKSILGLRGPTLSDHAVGPGNTSFFDFAVLRCFYAV